MPSHIGEDVWALAQFPDGFKGYACELGALDGVYLSNTQLLEENGWDVLCIEPNPRFYPGLREKRKLVLSCACGAKPEVSTDLWEHLPTVHFTQSTIAAPSGPGGWEVAGRVPVLTLDQCLEIVGFPRLDLLSLDVDGLELEILSGFDIKRWNPKVVILETGDGREDYVVSNGYRIDTEMDSVVRGGHNLCCVRNDA